jgi:hypothetical protein
LANPQSEKHRIKEEMKKLQVVIESTEEGIQSTMAELDEADQAKQMLKKKMKQGMSNMKCLSRQIIPGDDVSDQQIIAEVDKVRMTALSAVRYFLSKAQ